MRPRDMKSVTSYIPEEVWAALKQHAFDIEEPIAKIVSKLLKAYVIRIEKKKKKK